MKNNPYFVEAAQSLGESVSEYLSKTKYNYVIVEGTTPILWKGTNNPVIFGNVDEVGSELRNWPMPIKNISIITEEEYIKTYLGDAWERWTEDPNDSIMDEWGATHDLELIEKINHAWKKNREMFCPILCALYRRDIEEITDSDAFQVTKWIGSWQYNEGVRNDNWTPYMEMALEDMIKEWDTYAYTYLAHIADDCDLECILNFLHYPYLPIYKD